MNSLQACLSREAHRFGLPIECPSTVQFTNGRSVEATARIGRIDGRGSMYIFTDGQDLDRVLLAELSRNGVDYSTLSMPESEDDYKDCHEMFLEWGLIDE